MYSKTLYLNSIHLPYGKPLVFPIKKKTTTTHLSVIAHQTTHVIIFQVILLCVIMLFLINPYPANVEYRVST